MTNQHNTCPLCHGRIKKNGTTQAGTRRWRCTSATCGYSFTNTSDTAIQAKRFRIFLQWILTSTPLHTVADNHHRSRRQLQRWFDTFWYVTVPTNLDPHRIYEQIFIDGTYFGNNCLLIASSKTHVLAWHWCKHENTYNYNRLLDKIPNPPQVVTTDGHAGALKAIHDTWPTAQIQRCLVHVKRNIQQDVGLKPTLNSGKVLRWLSLQLLKVDTRAKAAAWTAKLHEFEHTYSAWLNEKTYIKDMQRSDIPTQFRTNKTYFYTHYRHRRAWKLLVKLHKKQHLFTFLTAVDDHGDTDDARRNNLASTTNSLEGGINAQVKNLARYHRGMSPEHQRTAIDWWCYLHTQYPDNPIEMARQQKWGRSALTKVTAASTNNTPFDHDGAPAQYDTGIESTHTNDIGIRRGTMR